jgi:elongation factor 2
MSGHHDSRLDALPTRDATLVMADCIDGLSSQTKEALREALAAGLKPILVLNNLDSCFLKLKLEGEEAYQAFCTIITDVNAFIKLHSTKRLKDVEVNPCEGTVLFVADTWGFSILDFAKICVSRFGSDQAKMTKRLWGGNYFDPSTQRWTPSPTGSASCKRGFVLYVYDSIKKILNSSIHDQKDRLLLMMQKLGHKEMNLHDLKGKELFEHIMQIWLPISHIICEVMVYHLLSMISFCSFEEYISISSYKALWYVLQDPTALNSEGLSNKLGHLVDSCRTREDVDAISKSYKKGHEVSLSLSLSLSLQQKRCTWQQK